MKSKENLLEQLKSLPHFSKSSIYQFGKQLGLADSTVDTYISRFIRDRDIIQLKKGLYIPMDFFSRKREDISYSFYLANVIRLPSYVSSWAALQYYNLTTEAIRNVTSVTLKVTRSYKIKAGNFDYQSIKRELFSGFSLIKGKSGSSTGEFDFFIASPAKALFDLLYFKTRQFRGVRPGKAKGLVEELRIDMDEMSKKERDKFRVMIKEHTDE